MKTKPLHCPNCGALSGVGWTDNTAHQQVIDCIRDLTETIEEIMPQMGKIVLQDYARLNRGLMASEAILGKDGKNQS